MTDLVDLDWENLGFDYMELPYRYRAHYKKAHLSFIMVKLHLKA